MARVTSSYGACSKIGFSLGQRYFANDSSSCTHSLVAAFQVRCVLKCRLVVLQSWNITSCFCADIETGKCLVMRRNRRSGNYRPPHMHKLCFDEDDNDGYLANFLMSFWCSKDVSAGQSKIFLRRLQQDWLLPWATLFR